jgi:hypothetical protein
MSVGDWSAWLENLARQKRQRRLAARYANARLEEWYVPFDVKPVPDETAIAVARFLGGLRIEWQRGQK